MSFLDFLYVILVTFLFLAYLMVLFSIISDLVRDRETSGWLKALWVVLLIAVPILTALVYLVVNGRKMADRQAREARTAQLSLDAYIRDVARVATPTDEVATAKGLLDAGAITREEYEGLKSRALGR